MPSWGVCRPQSLRPRASRLELDACGGFKRRRLATRGRRRATNGTSLKFFVWEKNEKIFFWDGAGIAAFWRNRVEYAAEFSSDCSVNVYIMGG